MPCSEAVSGKVLLVKVAKMWATGLLLKAVTSSSVGWIQLIRWLQTWAQFTWPCTNLCKAGLSTFYVEIRLLHMFARASLSFFQDVGVLTPRLQCGPVT
jgi:hypothetical protein